MAHESKPFFSIVIPLYNKDLVVRKTLISVLTQEEQDFEIIVVNDGSTDRSTEIVEDLKSSKLRLINQKNHGASTARNRGIKEATGKYIALLDADDLWKPNHLQLIKKLIETFPGCGFYATAHEVHLKDRVMNLDFGFEKGYEGIVERYFRHKIYFKKPGTSSSIVIPKYIFDKLGLFNDKYIAGEDTDMWYRIALKYPIAFSNHVSAIYKQDNDNVSRLSTYKKQIRGLSYKGIFENLLENKNQYYLKEYQSDIDHFVAHMLLQSSITGAKQYHSFTKIKYMIQRFKKIKNLGIPNIVILKAVVVLVGIVIRRRIIKRATNA